MAWLAVRVVGVGVGVGLVDVGWISCEVKVAASAFQPWWSDIGTRAMGVEVGLFRSNEKKTGAMLLSLLEIRLT